MNQYFIDSAVFLVYQAVGSLQARANSFTLPVIKDGKLGGMLLSYNAKEQISQVLAGPIIKAFLDDLKDGDYQGFPTLGIAFEQTLDDQLRALRSWRAFQESIRTIGGDLNAIAAHSNEALPTFNQARADFHRALRVGGLGHRPAAGLGVVLRFGRAAGQGGEDQEGQERQERGAQAHG